MENSCLPVHQSCVLTNLGVFFDSELTVTSHIVKVTAVCWYHLRQLCSYADRDVIARLVLSLVITRIDYCNAVLAGLLMHRCLHRCHPAYLMDIFTFNDTDTAVRHHLRSSTTWAAVVKWIRILFGQSSFSVAGPDIWNSLPPEIRLTENFLTLKKLKTHRFDIAFA